MNSNTALMKALVIMSRPASTLAVSQGVELVEVPQPSSHHQQNKKNKQEVSIQIQAAALQIEDLYTAIGRRPFMSVTPTPEHPVILGIEFSGTVVSSSGTENFKEGDVVMGCIPPFRVRNGCWAQFVTTSPNYITQVPTGWTKEQAASFGMSALVAQAAVDVVYNNNNNNAQQKQQQQQQRVGVVGASGCIGSFVTTLLAAKGAHVVAVCSERNAEFVLQQCGAKEVATRESGGLAALLYRSSASDDEGHTDKLPLDYVIDCVGGDRVEEDAAKALKKGGHFVTVVGPGEGTFGGAETSGGIGRGVTILLKTLRSKFTGTYSYTLASMSPFGIGSKLASIANTINESTDGKGPPVRIRTVAANDMLAVREALDSVANHDSGGRVILDFTVFADEQ